jgi:hypothetical protein
MNNDFRSNNNERLLLVNILNTMYNNNSRYIDSLIESNNQIRELLVSLLINRRTNNNTNNSSNNVSRRNNDSRRLMMNNRPYIIDSVIEYTIPATRSRDIINNLFQSPQNTSTSTNANANANANTTANANRNLLDSTLFNFDNILDNFFESVEIYPTQTQIENATRNVRYCDIVTPRNRSCPISLENFNDNDIVTVIRFCGHIFNTNEINTWFRSNCRCPVCRYDIRNYSNDTSNNNLTNNENINNQNNNLNQNTSNERNNSTTNFGNAIENILNSFYNTTAYNPPNNLLDLSSNIIDSDIDNETLVNIIRNYNRRSR